MAIRIFISILIIFIINSCVSKKTFIYVNGIKFATVQNYGAKGNGKNDDALSIQEAFQNEKNLYFPKGKYLIGSAFDGIHNLQSLIITDKTKARHIVFEKGAELYVKEDFPFNGIKNAILKIYTKSGDIDKIRIQGLTIFAENVSYSRAHTGVFAIENQGYEIKDLQIEDASFYNLSGAGIVTYALKTTLHNIYTENTTSNGMGSLNPYNLGREHYFFVDGYTSVNDKGYSIDFSGTEHAENRSIADPRDTWTGVAKNITSINSKRGIKTAGHWNLYLENVSIINPSIYGFFINKDAPGRKIKFKNMRIINSGDAGLSLAGNTGFEGDSLSLINCKMGAQIQNSDINITRMLIDGKGNAKMGLRFQSNGIISDFTVTGISDEYAVWVTAKKATLNNGKIFNNNSICGLLIHEAAEKTIIDNVEIYDDRENPVQNKDIFVIQKQGRLKIINSNEERTSKNRRKQIIENRSGINIETSY